MIRTSCFTLALVAVVCARMAYILPDGTDTIVANIKTTFKCDGRPYGYYADVANDCKIFHVCQPIADAEGQLLEMAHFSFLCGNLTIFSQESLTCTIAEDALPCSEAESFYQISNSGFGIIPEKDN